MPNQIVAVRNGSKPAKRGRRRQKYSRALIHENLELYAIMLPVLLLIFVLCYVPLYGQLIAFQDYTPGAPILSFDGQTQWVGWKYFNQFFTSPYFGRVVSNTLILSFYNIIFGFWIPIVFALLLNELKNLAFKKFVQTASYLPYFISAVVVAGMVLSFISTDGIVNDLRALTGAKRIDFSTIPSYFPMIYTSTNVWKSFGWNSILYLAAISGIDPTLYESAKLDGANRGQMVWYITLPMILPTIAIMLIFQVGSILGSNTDLVLLLYNPAVYDTSDVIGTYIYRYGLLNGQFSFGAAVGMFTSVMNFGLLFIANTISNKLTNYGLW